MHPILFRLPGLDLPIRSFGVMVAAGMFLAIWIWGKLLEKHGDDPEEDPLKSSQVAVWVVIGILVGARALYITVESARYLAADVTEEAEAVLEARGMERATLELKLRQKDPEALERALAVQVGHDFLDDPVQMLMVWKGGLVMYGGLFGAILFGLWRSRVTNLERWNAFDTCMVASFFGLAVGRWGCLLVGDDFGSVVPESYAHLPFPLTITVPEPEALAAMKPDSLFPSEYAGQKLWATQIWMSLNAIVVGLVGWLALRRRTWRGQAAAVILVHYSITRFLIEMFRGDEIRGVWFGTVSTSQLISIVGLAIGVALLLRRPGPPVEPRAGVA